MKHQEQLKYTPPDRFASDPVEPAAAATGMICLAPDIDRPQPYSGKTLGVIAGLVPAISIRPTQCPVIGMAGTSPAMTRRGLRRVLSFLRPRPDLWDGGSVLDLPKITEQAGEPEVPAIAANESWIPPAPTSDRCLWTGAAVISVLLHASVLLFFVEKSAPRASIGIEVISVDIVLGAEAEGGLAPMPSRSEVSPLPTLPRIREGEDQVSERAPDEEEFRRASPAGPEIAKQRVNDDVSESPPVAVADEAPVVVRDAVTTRDLVEPPPERIVHNPGREVLADPRQDAKRTPAKQVSKSARDRRPPSSAAASASNSVGHGRSDNDTNYRGIVAAHLARYKQFPADARGRGDEGNPAVTFTVDGGGRVVSVRLAHSAGIASLDQEVQAMVRRASPFPAPPAGQAMTFTVPVSFQLR